MPTPSELIELPFPLKGLSENFSYFNQPDGTTPEARNVLALDPRSGRQRGASRFGSRKFVSEQVGDTWIQCLDYVSQILPYSPILAEDGSPLLAEDGSPLLQEGSALQDFDRSVAAISVAGGTVKSFDRDGLTTVTNGTSALSATLNRIGSQSFFGDIFFADGTNSKYYDSGTNAVLAWVPTYSIDIDTASNTTPVVITTVLTHNLETGQSVTISGNSAPINGTWTVTRIDGLRFSLDTSTASGAGVNGTVSYTIGDTPIDDDGNRPQLICAWNGRLVMALDHELFGSALGDAFNWDYFPAVTNVGQAFLGSLTSMGMNPEPITSLVPISDDVLLVGCDRSIYRIRGNPVDGGRRDVISSITGMAYGRCWCIAPDGTLYFIGSRGGLYRMPMDGGLAVRISADTIDDRLSDLNMQENLFTLVWDDRLQMVIIFITPIATADDQTTIHYCVDPATNSFWEMTFVNPDHSPRAAILWDGPDPEDRCILLGGQDGYIRRLDPDATDDDGEVIESSVLLGPVTDAMILELQATFAKQGSVDWSIVEATTLEDATEALEDFSGTFTGGRNRSEWVRAHVSRGYLRLSSSEPWSLERLACKVAPDSEHRRRIYL